MLSEIQLKLVYSCFLFNLYAHMFFCQTLFIYICIADCIIGIELEVAAGIDCPSMLLPGREKECTIDYTMSSKSSGIAALRELLSSKLLRSTLLLWFTFYANSFA